MNNVEIYKEMQRSPRLFVKMMWGLEAQKRGEPFEKGKHYTWQQDEILESVEKAVKGEASKLISIRSGRGIGKSTTLSWLILWFLFCYKEAQVPCTAPSSDQMNDVLWKEIAKWLQRMPKGVQSKYEWTNTHIRITESPNTWFARARTARKETPEALSGIHADYLLLVVDEASAVPEEIFESAQGTMSGVHTFVILISNPTRLSGYFYDTHHKMRDRWQTLHYSSLESPVANEGEMVSMIREQSGEDSDEFRVSVLGEFPKADSMDARGYVPLLMESDLKQVPDEEFIGETFMGVDPSGEGDNETVWAVRDQFKAKVVAKEAISSPKSIAHKTYTLMDHYNVNQRNVTVDNFGIGANVAKEMALIESARIDVNGVNVGEKPKDSNTYVNLRAEAYARVRKWLRNEGTLVRHKDWAQLLTLKYRRNESGKMQMMSKLDMRREGYQSPDVADALMLTFVYESGGQQTTFQYTPNYSKLGYNRKL